MTNAMAIWLLEQLHLVVGDTYKQAILKAIQTLKETSENDKRIFDGEKRDCDHVSTDF